METIASIVMLVVVLVFVGIALDAARRAKYSTTSGSSIIIRDRTAIMSTAIEEIESKIRSLKPEEKAELLRSLIAELDGPPDADAEGAWLDAAKRRHREIVDGTVQSVPGDQVFQKVRALLKR